MRELIGSGTLFDQSALLLGSLGDTLSVTVFDDYQGTLLAILPPGAFIGLGLIVAVKNFIDLKAVEKSKSVVVNENIGITSLSNS
jgi:electron transport complex protein RnfE